MAICRIVETGVTPEQYDQVRGRVGVSDSMPNGAQLHIAGRGENGKIQIIEVWDSRDQADEFTEKVRAAREELGISGQPTITYLEVYNLIR